MTHGEGSRRRPENAASIAAHWPFPPPSPVREHLHALCEATMLRNAERARSDAALCELTPQTPDLRLDH